ncbi:MAG: outer membrane lipoprotein-sorting protein [Verrucomicrobia bacterium]|nr:outer membrane lipoprotein-sorting protein [Verrucomicrobiota bacterium]
MSYGQGSLRRTKIELLREIDHAEGEQRLRSFRQLWVEGDFSLKYTLQYIPRRGKRQEIGGTIWSSNVADGPVSQIRIHSEPEEELFLRNGPYASVLKRTHPSKEWSKVTTSGWFDPVDEGVTLTAFDLMMPFIYWNDWHYEGVTKVQGRVAHAFLMVAPKGLDANPLGLHGVVVFLDESFNAMLKADYVSKEDEVIKSFRLLDLKKVDGVWLPKTVDFLNENTRDKTRLIIKEAAVNRDFSDLPLGRGESSDHVPEIPLSDYQRVR